MNERDPFATSTYLVSDFKTFEDIKDVFKGAVFFRNKNDKYHVRFDLMQTQETALKIYGHKLVKDESASL